MTRTEIPPTWLSKSDLCRWLEMSRKGFDYWGVSPVGVVGTRHFYTLKDVLKNREENARKPNKLEKIEDENIAYEKYRLTKAQADAQELKNEIAKQSVIPTDFACFALSGVAAQAVGILESLPLTIVRKHPELTMVQQENIKRELSKAMNALSSLESKLPEMIEDYGTQAAKAL